MSIATPALVVTGQTLLVDLVAALLKQLWPEAVVEVGFAESPDGSVRVTETGSGRWILVTPGDASSPGVVKAIVDGAQGVVSAASDADDFARAADVLIGGTASHIPVIVARFLAVSLHAAHVPVRLTARERQVAALVAQGLTNREIGEFLTISTNTVRTHLHTLSVKLEATSRAKMVNRIRALGLLEPPEQLAIDNRTRGYQSA